MNSSDQIATVVINVSGGVVQDVVATKPVRVIVVDYDIDDALINDLPTVVARDGKRDKAAVAEMLVERDSTYVQGIESTVKL